MDHAHQKEKEGKNSNLTPKFNLYFKNDKSIEMLEKKQYNEHQCIPHLDLPTVSVLLSLIPPSINRHIIPFCQIIRK